MGLHKMLKIDSKCRLVWKDDQLIPLRRKEFEMPINMDNAVSCQIKQLRKKLGNSSEGKPFIETVWGVGYKFNQK